MSWLQRCGAEVGPVTLGKSGSGDGCGAFASRDIEEGEVLFTVPSRACVSVFDACGDEEVGDSLSQLVAKGQGGVTVALAGILAKEWLCAKDQGLKGPYLAMLPWDAEWPPEGEQEQEHVLWWSEAQVDKLEGSDAYADAVGLREEVATAARVIKSLIGASVRSSYKARGAPIWDVMRADDDIEKAVRGAFVSILTRSFGEEESAEGRRLVPLLDMLQHDTTPNVAHVAQLDEESGTQTVIVTARTPIAAGSELLNCYDGGELSDAKFLTRFGFVPGKSIGQFVDSISTKGRLPFGLKLG